MGSVALIVVQVAVFAVWPPPETVPEIFALMLRSPVLGLLSMDLLLLVNNLLVVLIYLALAVVLWAVSRSAVVLVLALGFVQMAAYVASNPAVELLTLARAHARAEAAGQAVLEGAGEVLLAGWTGTAFLVYYFLGAFVLLLLAWLLHRSTAFPPSAAWWALAAGVLMLVPASFGLVGLIFAFVSLIPWSVFCVVVAVRMLRLAVALGRVGCGRRERAGGRTMALDPATVAALRQRKRVQAGARPLAGPVWQDTFTDWQGLARSGLVWTYGGGSVTARWPSRSTPTHTCSRPPTRRSRTRSRAPSSAESDRSRAHDVSTGDAAGGRFRRSGRLLAVLDVEVVLRPRAVTSYDGQYRNIPLTCGNTDGSYRPVPQRIAPFPPARVQTVSTAGSPRPG